KREFLFNLIFLILINLMIKPLYIFGIDVGVQNAVGPENYGLYFYLLGFIYLFQFINDFGIQNFNNRFISLNEKLLGKYFPHIFSLKMVLGLTFFALVIGVGLSLNLVELNPLLFFIVALNLFLDSLNAYLRSNIAGLGWYRRDSILSVTDKLIMIVICGLLLLNPVTREAFQIEWFALAQTASFLCVTLLSLFYMRGKTAIRMHPPGRKYFFLILKKSWPFALILLSSFFYNRLDAVMIGWIMEDGERQAGYYAAGYRLYDAASMFTFLFAGLLYPMFSKMLSRGENPSGLYKMGIQLLWMISLAVLFVFIFIPSEIMHGLYLDPGPEAATVLILLGFAFVFKSIFHISGSLMLSYGDLKVINIIFISGMILNFILNAILIPRTGIVGACWATLITQGLVALSLYYRSVKLSQYKVGIGLLMAGLSTGALVALAAYYFQEFSGEFSLLQIVLVISSMLVLLGGISLFIVLNNSNRLRKWWTN
nr:oligosaccharide flippase family protein [Saprospiraceae bacterium]